MESIGTRGSAALQIGAAILANVDGVDWPTVAANLGGSGVIAAILWWVLTKRMPEQEKAYRDDIRHIVTEFTKERRDDRVTWETQLREERTSRENQNEAFRKAVIQVSEQTKEVCDEVIQRMNDGGTKQNRGATQDTR